MRSATRRVLAGFLMTAFLTGTGWAQESGVWVQIEARRTLSDAQTQVRGYAGRLDDVVGYSLGSGWYGIALGPYARGDAEAVLRELRSRGAIPQDSFIVDGSNFGQQFWPIGTGAETRPQPLPEGIARGGTAEETAAAPGSEPQPEVAAAPETPEPETPEIVTAPEPVADETLREAQASEADLSLAQKKALQVALQWAGFYDSTIDGLYGRGTRAAMAAWQEANGHEATGVLTTRQRAELLAAYNSVLEGMGLALVRDEATGIEMEIPTGVVSFAAYDPPFARFEASGEIPAMVLLISQEGDRTRLFGLYEILQTLEIVPPEGPRTRQNDGFVLEGIDGSIHSHTEARLENGVIKGFTLVWPAGDEERRSRILGAMQASFTRIDGALDPALAQPGEEQGVDLVSGLAIRRPVLSRSGFFIDARGTVLTTAEAVAECREVTIDAGFEARVAHVDTALNLAVLTPVEALAPMRVAEFQTGIPRIQAEIAVAGYPFGGLLAAPALTFGRLADVRGLNGEEAVKRLSIQTAAGDAGGPVLDNGGAVIGMLLPQAGGAQVLPPDVQFSVDAETILAELAEAGIQPRTTGSIAAITPETLTRRAAEMTVLVNCWD